MTPSTRVMDDAELLRDAITESGLSSRRFAREILDVDERTVRAWLAGRPMPMAVRMLCFMLTKAWVVTPSTLVDARERLDARPTK